MESHVLHIRNMMCPRCIWAVEGIMNNLGIAFEKIELGQVITTLPKNEIENIQELKKALQELGFELIEEKKKLLTEQIRHLIIFWVEHIKEENGNFSDFLSSEIGKDYKYLSKVFSEVENLTIEKYLILQKIEKARKLIIFDELNMVQISDMLGYSSSAHFSGQFKHITGYSPFQFKKRIKDETK